LEWNYIGLGVILYLERVLCAHNPFVFPHFHKI
jgi:hypothetical protein